MKLVENEVNMNSLQIEKVMLEEIENNIYSNIIQLEYVIVQGIVKLHLK